MTEQEKVFAALRTGFGKSTQQIADEVGFTVNKASDTLVNLRIKGCAATYGGGRNARWLAVPEAKIPTDSRGKSTGSVANLRLGPMQIKHALAFTKAEMAKLEQEAKEMASKPPPDLSWASLLGG